MRGKFKLPILLFLSLGDLHFEDNDLLETLCTQASFGICSDALTNGGMWQENMTFRTEGT